MTDKALSGRSWHESELVFSLGLLVVSITSHHPLMTRVHAAAAVSLQFVHSERSARSGCFDTVVSVSSVAVTVIDSAVGEGYHFAPRSSEQPRPRD